MCLKFFIWRKSDDIVRIDWPRYKYNGPEGTMDILTKII